MTNRITTHGAFVVVLLAGLAASQTQTQSPSTQAQGSSTGVKVNPSQVQKKAATAPPPGAAKTSSVGQNMSMATPPNSDSWVEQIDVDGNGTAEQTNVVWDGTDKVLMSDSSGTFTCQNGTTGDGELLVAVNAAGNKWGRPVGSGFWVASMDKGQCGLPQNALWGCKFDASGNPTTCGVATMDQQNKDIVIVTAQQ